MAKKTQQLSRTNRIVKCAECGKPTHSQIQGASTGLCRACFENAGNENEHLDMHSRANPTPGCKFCEGRA